jgi:methyl-accepting chemotaxis protein
MVKIEFMRPLDMVLSPLSWLLRRVPLFGKIMMVAIVLAVPLTVSVLNERDAAAGDIRFARSEQRGVAAVSALMKVSEVVREARFASVMGDEPTPLAKVNSMIQVLRADETVVSLLSTTSLDDIDKAVAAAASSTSSPSGRLVEWTAALDAVEHAIVEAADRSLLTLDPELSAYYLGSILTSSLPIALNEADRVVLYLHVLKVFGENKARLRELAVATDRLEVQTVVVTDVLAKAQSGFRVDAGRPFEAEVNGITRALRTISDAGDSALLGPKVLAERLDSALVVEFDQLVLQQLSDELDARVRELQSRSVSRLLAVAGFVLGGLLLSLAIARVSSTSVRSVRARLANLANGDLSERSSVVGTDEFARMEVSLNEAIMQTRTAIVDITASSGSVTIASQQIGSLSSQLASQAATTTSQASQVSVATEQLADAIREISVASSSATEVAFTAQSMASDASETIRGLDARSNEIGSVVAAITEIAELTHLLALNASIEAARAGTAGRGFAVVADEVKALANDTAKATEAIAIAIGRVQVDTGHAVAAIGQISDVIDQVNAAQQTISSAVEEQAVTTREITDVVAGFTQSAAETGRGAEMLAGVAETLVTSGQSLGEMTSRYRW